MRSLSRCFPASLRSTRFNNFVVDGLSGNDDAADLAGTFYSQEVIREFQVITSGGISEFGRASSGIINIITQSGTNDLHGRLYGFARNQRFDARNPLATRKDYDHATGRAFIQSRRRLSA